jgi:hypothetical protein
MRIGLVAPLIKPEHLQDLGLPPDVLDEVGPDLADRNLREAQVWSPDGLAAVLQRHGGADANHRARKIPMRAFRDDPFGLVRLGSATLLDYFNDAVALPRLWDDLGSRPPDDGLIALMRERLRYDASGVATLDTTAYRWFAAARWWITACLFALPLLAILLVLANRGRAGMAPALLLALGLAGFFLAQLLFSHIVSFRYLHPLPPLVLLTVGALWQGWRARAPR